MELSPAIPALITTQKQLSGWPIPLLRQLWVCMGLEFRQSPPALRRQEEIPVSLTARQQVILRLIAQGMTDKQIAAELRICQDTVRYHKKNLYRLLEAENGAQAVFLALRTGLLPR